MTGIPRIDLTGVALLDQNDPTTAVAVFRYRTTNGLILLMPESAEFLVPWDAIEQAQLDLMSGHVRIQFTAAYATSHNWLRGGRSLSGSWTDRFTREG